MSQIEGDYQFTTDWFSYNISQLSAIFQHLKPKKILEVGSFEGRSTVFFIEEALKYQSDIEIHCIDTWQGAAEHIGVYDMPEVEKRFLHNIDLATKRYPSAKVYRHRGTSHQQMTNMLAQGLAGEFDYVYIDGSHEAPDVLFDALLAHRLTRIDGIISFDDYLWSPDELGRQNHYMLVKPAVDSYVNIYQQKIQIVGNLALYQFHVIKKQE